MKYWKKGGDKNEGGDRREGNHTKELGSLQIVIVEIICTLIYKADRSDGAWLDLPNENDNIIICHLRVNLCRQAKKCESG